MAIGYLIAPVALLLMFRPKGEQGADIVNLSTLQSTTFMVTASLLIVGSAAIFYAVQHHLRFVLMTIIFIIIASSVVVNVIWWLATYNGGHYYMALGLSVFYLWHCISGFFYLWHRAMAPQEAPELRRR